MDFILSGTTACHRFRRRSASSAEDHLIQFPGYPQLPEEAEVRQEKSHLVEVVRIAPQRQPHPLLQAEFKKFMFRLVLVKVDLRRDPVARQQIGDRRKQFRRFLQPRPGEDAERMG